MRPPAEASHPAARGLRKTPVSQRAHHCLPSPPLSAFLFGRSSRSITIRPAAFSSILPPFLFSPSRLYRRRAPSEKKLSYARDRACPRSKSLRRKLRSVEPFAFFLVLFPAAFARLPGEASDKSFTARLWKTTVSDSRLHHNLASPRTAALRSATSTRVLLQAFLSRYAAFAPSGVRSLPRNVRTGQGTHSSSRRRFCFRLRPVFSSMWVFFFSPPPPPPPSQALSRRDSSSSARMPQRPSGASARYLAPLSRNKYSASPQRCGPHWSLSAVHVR